MQNAHCDVQNFRLASAQARTVRAHGLLASNSTIGDVAARGLARLRESCVDLGYFGDRTASFLRRRPWRLDLRAKRNEEEEVKVGVLSVLRAAVRLAHRVASRAGLLEGHAILTVMLWAFALVQ